MKKSPRGRKPLPTAILKAQGTYRKDRHENEIEESASLRFVGQEDYPMPFEEMKEAECKLWHQAIGEIIRVRGWVSYTDLFLFKRWCVNGVLLNDLDDKCSKAEYIVSNAHGNEMVNPIYKLRDTTEKTFIKLCAEFGLSPSSRNGITLAQPEEEKEKEPDFEI